MAFVRFVAFVALPSARLTGGLSTPQLQTRLPTADG